MPPATQPAEPKQRPRFSLNVDSRVIIIVLLLVIGVMLFLWKPWDSTSDDRTIEVTGQATLKAAPDEFIFYPTYTFEGDDKDAAIAALSAKSEEVVAKLKELGVPDNKIKTNSDGRDYPVYLNEITEETSYNLTMTIVVDSRDMAQKVQDYLLTTTPEGTITPQPTFSEAKRKELESQARDQAAKDARAKADQSAKNLGFKVGKVKSVTDGLGFGGIIPLEGRAAPPDSGVSSSQLSVQPGENELSYTVTVMYYLD